MAADSDVWPLADSFERWMSSILGWRTWQQSRLRAAGLACAAPETGAEMAIKDPSIAEPTSTQSTIPSTPAPIFTTEWFKVAPSPKGGYGCFALKTIEEGTKIFSELPLIEATDAEFLGLYQALPEPMQKEFMSLAGWELLSADKAEAIWKNNRFKTGRSSAVFAKSSRINHACMPFNTCTYSFDYFTGEIQFTTIKKVAPGQELTISYSSNATTLYNDYGFFCDCEGCPKYSEEEKKKHIEKKKREFNHYLKARW